MNGFNKESYCVDHSRHKSGTQPTPWQNKALPNHSNKEHLKSEYNCTHTENGDYATSLSLSKETWTLFTAICQWPAAFWFQVNFWQDGQVKGSATALMSCANPEGIMIKTFKDDRVCRIEQEFCSKWSAWSSHTSSMPCQMRHMENKLTTTILGQKCHTAWQNLFR